MVSEWDCCAELELHWELSESTRDLALDGQGEDEVVDTDMPELSWSTKNFEDAVKIGETNHNITITYKPSADGASEDLRGLDLGSDPVSATSVRSASLRRVMLRERLE